VTAQALMALAGKTLPLAAQAAPAAQAPAATPPGATRPGGTLPFPRRWISGSPKLSGRRRRRGAVRASAPKLHHAPRGGHGRSARPAGAVATPGLTEAGAVARAVMLALLSLG
jgi:hypothetical protein